MKRNNRQTRLGKDDFLFDPSEHSLYIQTTWKFYALKPLILPNIRSRIWFFEAKEADELAEALMKRNVFSRHSWENDFYVSRVKRLSGRSAIEIAREGDPDSILDEAQATADIIEKTALLSASLVMHRKDLQNEIGINHYLSDHFNVTLGKKFRYLRSKSKPDLTVKGITIDDRFCRRFHRCNFDRLASFCTSNTNLAKRVVNAVYWQSESVQEVSLAAACVKSSIALESILIFDQSEPLVKNLCERSAFLLSNDPEERKVISGIIRKFYDERSKIVHHGYQSSVSLSLIDVMNKLLILLCLSTSCNNDLWKTDADLRNWCEDRKMGVPTIDFSDSYPRVYLKRAIEKLLLYSN